MRDSHETYIDYGTVITSLVKNARNALKETGSMKIRRFPTLLVQGFFALLPLIVTLYTGILAFRLVENVVDNVLSLFPKVLQEDFFFVIAVEAISVVVFIAFLIFFGYLTRSLAGKAIVKSIKAFFSFIPGLNSVYGAAEQVVAVLSGEKKNFFQHPVLVEYPSPGIWAIAFNTGEIDTKDSLTKQRRYTIFIPTTPNPTSGFLAVVTEEKIREFDISAEDAIKLILTGGIVKAD